MHLRSFPRHGPLLVGRPVPAPPLSSIMMGQLRGHVADGRAEEQLTGQAPL